MSLRNAEHGSETRYNGEKFGYGKYTARSSGPNQDTMTHALRLGWSNGCPIAHELTGPTSPYGIDWMINRYSDTNQMYGLMRLMAQRENRAVYQYLTQAHFRLADEPVGKHESNSVPPSHAWKISPMTGINGYAAPQGC